MTKGQPFKRKQEIPLQLSLFGESQTLVSIDPKQNRYRYYYISVTKDKQVYTIEREWGRLQRKKTVNLNLSKGYKCIQYSNQKSAYDEYSQLIRKKYRNGYVRI